MLTNCKVINTLTANVKIYKNDNFVTKTFITTLTELNIAEDCKDYPCACGFNINSVFNHEIKTLKKLENYSHFPKILDIDENKKTIKMTYCGLTLQELKDSKKYKVVQDIKNLDEQIIEISNILDSCYIQHYDLCYNNICVLDNKIFVIDFVCSNKTDDDFIKGYNFNKIKKLFDEFKSNTK